jgi:hypothetical protein
MINHRNVKTCLLLLVLIAGLSSCTRAKAPPEPKFEGYSDEPAGDGKTITFRWSAPTGRDKNVGRTSDTEVPKFSVCITAKSGAKAGGSNTCYDLVNVSCTISAANSVLESRDCTGQLALPSVLEGVQNDWYVRAENPNDEKLYSNSNTRPFDWRVALANLQITDDSEPKIVGTKLSYPVEITNSGDAPATNVVVRFNVELNAGGVALPPQSFDKVSQKTLFGTNQNQGFDTDDLRVEVPIGGLARPLEYLFVVAVDPDNTIAESNEADNTWPPRNGTIH